MHYYYTLALIVLLQASVPSWFGKHTTIESKDTLVWRKLWQYYKGISIGQNSNNVLENLLDPTLHVPFQIQP